MTTTESGSTDPAGIVDMGDEELMRDPFTGYSDIRERAALVRGAIPGVDPVWLVTRYDDVKMVLSDSRFVVDPGNVPGLRLPSLNEQVVKAYEIPPDYLQYRLARMGLFDGAAHARLRTLVSHAFTARRVAGLRRRVEEITAQLLDRLPAVAEDGVVDLLSQFALLLSSTVLCELVGIPVEDRAQWREWDTIAAPGKGQDKETAWREVVDYTRELVERRRAEPTDDLISALVLAQAEGARGRRGGAGRRKGEKDDPLTDTEMIAMIVMLGLTSQQTAHLITNGTLALLTHPAQLALLRENPELMPQAVHELLRWTTPTQVVPRMRYAAEDLLIGDMLVRKGEAVAATLVAANYDPRRFDDPERLDITREPDGHRETHVAFGGGPHYCLGAALARQEAEVAFTAILRRFPGLALAVDPGDLERELMPGHWRLAALPVRL